MESQQTRRSTTSRRDARDSARTPRTRRPSAWTSFAALLPKAAVVGALGAATIAVPVAHATSESAQALTGGNSAATALPTAFEVLSETTPRATQTALLAAPTARPLDSAASRGLGRESLSGCDGSSEVIGTNGQLSLETLCQLWDPAHMLRGDAAIALGELNASFRAAFGRNLCLTDSYRTLEVQQQLRARKPGLAATPGTSNHGWALAIDLCSTETGRSDVMRWLHTNGPVYGWVNPEWAAPGRGRYEPWHWEYEPGTTEFGTDFS